MERRMLAIPRPETRLECGQEARPCPWVSCRHHLLLEVAESHTRLKNGELRPTQLRMNGPAWMARRAGRRSGLASSDAAVIVRQWIEEAAETVSRMPYTCTFDVVRDFPEGIPPSQIGEFLGVTAQLIDQEVRVAVARAKAAVERRFRDELEAEDIGALMVHDTE